MILNSNRHADQSGRLLLVEYPLIHTFVSRLYQALKPKLRIVDEGGDGGFSASTFPPAVDISTVQHILDMGANPNSPLSLPDHPVPQDHPVRTVWGHFLSSLQAEISKNNVSSWDMSKFLPEASQSKGKGSVFPEMSTCLSAVRVNRQTSDSGYHS